MYILQYPMPLHYLLGDLCKIINYIFDIIFQCVVYQKNSDGSSSFRKSFELFNELVTIIRLSSKNQIKNETSTCKGAINAAILTVDTVTLLGEI
jgi:hypothetical protein